MYKQKLVHTYHLRRGKDLHIESCRDDTRPLGPKHSDYGHGYPVAKGNHEVDDAEAKNNKIKMKTEITRSIFSPDIANSLYDIRKVKHEC